MHRDAHVLGDIGIDWKQLSASKTAIIVSSRYAS